MKIRIITVIAFMGCFSLYGQNTIDKVLAEVEKNNTGIMALRKKTEAEKIGNRTDIFLSDPELGFNYLYDNPAGTGNRTDVSIIQKFDFPTAYVYRGHIAEARNIQAELEYHRELKNLLYRTHLLCIDILYANALNEEYGRQLANARSLASSLKAKLENGEAGVLDYNRAQLNLLNISNETDNNKIYLNSLVSELAALNGGIPITPDQSVLAAPALPADFENWYLEAEQNNPILSWLKQEIEIADMQQKLSVAESLPKLSAGYMSEKIPGEQFHGISAGISVPLWENKNSIRYAKANALAVRSMETDKKLVFYNQLKTQYEKASALQKRASDYRFALGMLNSSALLEKSFGMGEISIS
ncbi:MAG: TolC family protein, partial [Bacteroidales bacterium]|nr:TolC family protein [Bacteroidales bacterium]